MGTVSKALPHTDYIGQFKVSCSHLSEEGYSFISDTSDGAVRLRNTATGNIESFQYRKDGFAGWSIDCETGCLEFCASEPEEPSARFLNAINRKWDGYIIAPGCRGVECEFAEADDIPEEHSCEGSFSWYECEGCGSKLGGDRHKAQAFKIDNSDETITEIEICVDCLMFHANGDLPEEWGG